MAVHPDTGLVGFTEGDFMQDGTGASKDPTARPITTRHVFVAFDRNTAQTPFRHFVPGFAVEFLTAPVIARANSPV